MCKCILGAREALEPRVEHVPRDRRRGFQIFIVFALFTKVMILAVSTEITSIKEKRNIDDKKDNNQEPMKRKIDDWKLENLFDKGSLAIFSY